MLSLTGKERLTLTLIGALALAGLGADFWQQQRPPITVAAGTAPAGAPWDEALRHSRRVDVNTATVAELERLPEVGPGLAGRIAAYRAAHGRFRTAEELTRVKGIGPKTYEALRDYVTTGQ